MYKNKKGGLLGIVITIVVLILIVIFSNREANTSFFENVANKLVMPIQNGLTYLKNRVSGNSTFFTDISNLKSENQDLKEKNSQLEQSLRELENIKTENETLKEYLGLTEKYGEYKTVPGYVIDKEISNYSKTIIINIGKNDGIEVNMTVIADDIRFRTLGTDYGEDEIKAVLEGKAKHQPYQKKPPKEQPFQLLVDIQGKMAEGKSVGYKKWATKFNLKEMSKTLLFLQEQKISSADELRERAAAATERYHAMGDSIKAAEARLTEIAVLKTHIINYAKTRPVYDAYRKSGYSKKYLEAHREEITLHKAAKAVFDEAGLQKLPKVKALDAEFAELLTKKKAAYPDYRKARNEMQELVRAQKNVERFFAEEKQTHETEQVR